MIREAEKDIIINKQGPIIIIEDDPDDQEILAEIFYDLNYKNEILFFNDGEAALVHIKDAHELPFLILSDINMPKLNGLGLRDKLKNDARLRNKCIPYLFFSTVANQKTVIDAYGQSVQGFFVKEATVTEIKTTIRIIVEYWRRCATPNDFLV
jgi:CheY-like chemotaxis protein